MTDHPGKHFLWGFNQTEQTTFAKLYVGQTVQVAWSPYLIMREQRSVEWLSKNMNSSIGKVRMVAARGATRLIVLDRAKRKRALLIPLACIYSISLMIPGYDEE